MLSVGQQIRDQRLRLGLKLEEISARTRIPLKTLQAIETDDLANISSPFLYRSFARQFAEHLKLDFSRLAPLVQSVALTMPRPRVPGEEDFAKTNIAPLPLKDGRSRNFRWLYSVASLGFMLVACSSVYGLWQNAKSTWLVDLGSLLHSTSIIPAKAPAATPSINYAPASPSAPARVERPVPRSLRQPTRPPNQDQTFAAADPAPASSADQDASEFHVELSAIERTWVSIVEDGRQTFSGVLDPEQTKVLEGHETARIRTGNAGGISCIFNGKSIGLLGPRGQVRTVVFTRSNYEVLDATAHIALTRFPSIAE